MVWKRENPDDVEVLPIKYKGNIFGKIVKVAVDVD